MLKREVLTCILAFTFLSAVVESKECDISGVWNHATKSAELEIDIASGEIAVHSHKNNSQTIGLVVIKELKMNDVGPNWSGKMFSAAENDFVGVKIQVNSCRELIVSLNSELVLTLTR